MCPFYSEISLYTVLAIYTIIHVHHAIYLINIDIYVAVAILPCRELFSFNKYIMRLYCVITQLNTYIGYSKIQQKKITRKFRGINCVSLRDEYIPIIKHRCSHMANKHTHIHKHTHTYTDVCLGGKNTENKTADETQYHWHIKSGEFSPPSNTERIDESLKVNMRLSSHRCRYKLVTLAKGFEYTLC
jgi:hypothetical protein